MAWIVKNVRDYAIDVDGVKWDPGQQLRIVNITLPIQMALNDKHLTKTLDETTREERHADILAFKPFKTGDPAIDG